MLWLHLEFTNLILKGIWSTNNDVKQTGKPQQRVQNNFALRAKHRGRTDTLTSNINFSPKIELPIWLRTLVEKKNQSTISCRIVFKVLRYISHFYIILIFASYFVDYFHKQSLESSNSFRKTHHEKFNYYSFYLDCDASTSTLKV